MISIRMFRALVVASLILGFAGGVLSMFLTTTLPPALQDYLRSIEIEPLTPSEVVTMVGLVVLLVICIIVTVGLYRFKPWSRRAGLILTVLGLPVGLFFGPVVEPAASQLLFDVSILFWGAVLASAYWSPISQHFTERGLVAA